MPFLVPLMVASALTGLVCLLTGRVRSPVAWALGLITTAAMVLCSIGTTPLRWVVLAGLTSSMAGVAALVLWRFAPSQLPMPLHRAISTLLMSGLCLAHALMRLVADAPPSGRTEAVVDAHAVHSGPGQPAFVLLGVLLFGAYTIYTVRQVMAARGAAQRDASAVGEMTSMGAGVGCMFAMLIVH